MITAHGFKYERFQFPTGEPHIRILDVTGPSLSIDFDYTARSTEDLLSEVFCILLINDALYRAGCKLNKLTIYYCPFGRQDRVATAGDPISIAVFANVINSMNLDLVELIDPHSDMSPALIRNSEVIPQHEVLLPYFKRRNSEFYLVIPDQGSTNKINKLASIVQNLGVVHCAKVRDPVTGRLSGTHIPEMQRFSADAVIADDICDGGGTFIMLAEKLRPYTEGKIILVVSHGMFTKGLSVFENVIDEVWARGKRML